MKRHATEKEQQLIDKANEVLSEMGLVITETQDKNGGAVIPTKGF